MSRRPRVPAPFSLSIPSVIRSFGPRLLLIATACAALAFIGGGSYLVAHFTQKPTPAPVQAKPAAKTSANSSRVLGSETTTPSTTPSTEPSPPAAPPSTAATSTPASTVAVPAASASTKASFDIVIDPNAIRSGVATITVPFTIVRHGGLSTPIKPAAVSIYAGGSLTNLITVQSETMFNDDTGALVLAPIGLFPRDITALFTATSGGVSASTSFTYHISL